MIEFHSRRIDIQALHFIRSICYLPQSQWYLYIVSNLSNNYLYCIGHSSWKLRTCSQQNYVRPVNKQLNTLELIPFTVSDQVEHLDQTKLQLRMKCLCEVRQGKNPVQTFPLLITELVAPQNVSKTSNQVNRFLNTIQYFLQTFKILCFVALF